MDDWGSDPSHLVHVYSYDVIEEYDAPVTVMCERAWILGYDAHPGVELVVWT